MNYVIDFFKNVYIFLGTDNLSGYGWFGTFMFLLLIAISLDIFRINNNDKNDLIYKVSSFLIFIFFLVLYLHLSEYMNLFVEQYQQGELDNQIKDSENLSSYYTNTIGNSYNTAILALLSGLFASFIKLQFILIEKNIFSQLRITGSIFINMILTLNIFSVLIFIDQLPYSEFKISESDALHLGVPTYFFSILIIFSLIFFIPLVIFYKDKILNNKK